MKPRLGRGQGRFPGPPPWVRRSSARTCVASAVRRPGPGGLWGGSALQVSSSRPGSPGPSFRPSLGQSGELRGGGIRGWDTEAHWLRTPKGTDASGTHSGRAAGISDWAPIRTASPRGTFPFGAQTAFPQRAGEGAGFGWELGRVSGCGDGLRSLPVEATPASPPPRESPLRSVSGGRGRARPAKNEWRGKGLQLSCAKPTPARKPRGP